MDPAAQQIPPGEQIGPYQVVKRLGAGGMGEVYLARHRHLNRDAAIKVLLAEISMNQTVVSRFFTEARATAQLRHPNIVEVFDCDVLADGRAYIVMEYLRGESLRGTLDRVSKLSPDWGSVAAISGMVANALQAAHESGIVHRDLKPDNTYLCASPNPREGLTVKVLDFGIAKLLSGGDRTGGGATPTRTGSLIGTPLYMSPEQCRGIPTIDHRADIYSLGCVMFEMITGKPPFVSDAPGDILMAHIIQNAPALSTLQAGVPPEIETLVARMLEKDPAVRPQSMAEIVALVESLLGTRKTEFATVLRKPTGFPEAVGQAATQVLPVVDTPSRSTPGRGIADAVATTPLPRAPTPSRAKPTPAPSSRRPQPSDELPSLSPGRPKWIVPVAVIATVVALGGIAAYALSKPKTAPVASEPAATEPTKNAEPVALAPDKAGGFVPPSEVKVEIASAPPGAAVWIAGEESPRGTTPLTVTLPRATTAVDVTLKVKGYSDKHLTLDASRDNTMNVNLEPAPATSQEKARELVRGEKDGEKTAAPRRKAGGKSTGASGGFKAVGD